MFHRPALPPGGSVYACGTPGEFDGYAMTDGTVKRGCAACAYVLLDDRGHEIAARWSRMNAPTRDSTQAEFAALALALDAAHERGYFSHVTPDGKDPLGRIRQAGVRFLVAGENLALAPTLAGAHRGLMDSPGHRANILKPAYGRVGIGVLDAGRYGLVVTQNFRN